MQRALPISWFILAGLVFVGSALSYLPWIRAGTPIMVVASLPSAISRAAFVLAIAAAYLLMERTVPSKASIVLGWGHLGAFSITKISAYWLSYQLSAAQSADEVFGSSSLFLTNTVVSVIFGLLGTLCFFAAMLIAAIKAKRSINLTSFD